MTMRNLVLAAGLLLCLAQEALADNTFILATGRRDPRMYVIDLKEALKPGNNNTPNAIVSRAKTALDRLDGKLLGDPANVIISEDGKTAYVVNHHGAIDNDEFLQHGGRGNIAVMDIGKMTKRQQRQYRGGARDAISTAATSARWASFCCPTCSSSAMPRATSRRTAATASRSSTARQAAFAARSSWRWAIRGSHAPSFRFRSFRRTARRRRCRLLSPNPGWGCFPGLNGITLGTANNGKTYLFTANGGTDDVSVIDLAAALAGDKTAEVARIPTQIGPWGIVTSPNGRWVVAANRESQRVAFEGNTISIIDANLAASDPAHAEVARVRVGTDDPNVQTRPFIPSFTPDGDSSSCRTFARTMSRSSTFARARASTRAPRSRAFRSRGRRTSTMSFDPRGPRARR